MCCKLQFDVIIIMMCGMICDAGVCDFIYGAGVDAVVWYVLCVSEFGAKI